MCALVGLVVGEVVAPWWDSAVYYRVVVDSFKDADGDGLGDLKGKGQSTLASKSPSLRNFIIIILSAFQFHPK